MLKNLKISVRLMMAFLIAILISSIGGATGIVLLNSSDKTYGDALVNYGFAQGDIGNLGRHFQASRSTTLYTILAQDEKTLSEFQASLAQNDAQVDADMVLVKKGLGSELGQKVYASLETAMANFRTQRNAVLAKKTMDADSIALVEQLKADCAAPSGEVAGIIDTMLADKTKIGSEQSVKLSKQSLLFSWVIAAIMGGAFLIAMVLAWFISRSISVPLSQIEVAAAKLAKGDYNVSLAYKAKDEVGNLTRSMQEMIDTTESIISDTARGLGEIAKGNFEIHPTAEYIGVFKEIETAMIGIISGLSETMEQITIAADQVAGGSDQVSSSAQALAQGATEQSSSVEELSASIATMEAQIKMNAENSIKASDEANAAAVGIEKSNDQMQHLMLAMQEINEKSSQISKIIKTIEDIAFQTNILALNAAVEAARAGEAGKGFAVVADEVRNLASKSGEAAKDTTALIEGSIIAVENGTKIANESAKDLMSIVAGTKQATFLIGEVTKASNEQAVAVSQISIGVNQISSVVQTNSATSEQSAAASEELSSQASLMKSLLGKFTLSTGALRAKAAPKMAMPHHLDPIEPMHKTYSSFDSGSSKY